MKMSLVNIVIYEVSCRWGRGLPKSTVSMRLDEVLRSWLVQDLGSIDLWVQLGPEK